MQEYPAHSPAWPRVEPVKLNLRQVGLVILAAIMVPAAGPAAAGTDSWVGSVFSPNWDFGVPNGLSSINYVNWNTGSLPTATTDVVFGPTTFSTLLGNPNLNGSRTINTLTFSAPQAFTLTGNVGNTLTLAGGNFTPAATSTLGQSISQVPSKHRF